MTAKQLREELSLNLNRYYLLRAAGVIPAPLSGVTARKWYSDQEVAEIRKRVEAESGKRK